MSDKAAKRKRKLHRWLETIGLGMLTRLVDKYPSLVVNKQFDRIEIPGKHFYIKHWAPVLPGTAQRLGRIKCKLMHGKGWTVIVPDQIFIQHGSKWLWIQPLGFGPNHCYKLDDEFLCELRIDISAGESVNVRFMGKWPVRTFDDGAHLYECEIFGPVDLLSHATGHVRFNAQLIPYLHLYHHTSNDTRPKILNSGYFRAGDFNIQGTTKRLVNVAYAYFTPLSAIKTDDDLRKIAMASDGKLQLRRDGVEVPEPIPPGMAKNYPADILELDVYPSDPTKREAVISVWIDSTILAPAHIYRHEIQGGAVFYEIPHEFIQRVGLQPGASLPFDNDGQIDRGSTLKSFDYIVVGDCTSLAGLAAPYDEENTEEVLKIERVVEGQSFTAFWFEHANTDLFSGKSPEMQKFKSEK